MGWFSRKKNRRKYLQDDRIDESIARVGKSIKEAGVVLGTVAGPRKEMVNSAPRRRKKARKSGNRFEIRLVDSSWIWVLIAQNGNVLAESSEGYKKRYDATLSARKLAKQVSDAKLVVLDRDGMPLNNS